MGFRCFAQELAHADTPFSVIDGGTGTVSGRMALLREARKLSSALWEWDVQTGDCVVLSGSNTVRLGRPSESCSTGSCDNPYLQNSF